LRQRCDDLAYAEQVDLSKLFTAFLAFKQPDAKAGALRNHAHRLNSVAPLGRNQAGADQAHVIHCDSLYDRLTWGQYLDQVLLSGPTVPDPGTPPSWNRKPAKRLQQPSSRHVQRRQVVTPNHHDDVRGLFPGSRGDRRPVCAPGRVHEPVDAHPVGTQTGPGRGDHHVHSGFIIGPYPLPCM